MRIFISGISCVGKTTIGAKLGDLLGRSFYDLDDEIERYFSTSIERLQNKFLTMYSFREEASKALKHLLNQENSQDFVIALPPSGLMGAYWRIVKKSEGTIIVLLDDATNVLDRLTFFDIDSKPIEKHLTEKEKKIYLKEIKKDFTYYKTSYKRADILINIAGLNPDQSASKIKTILENYWQNNGLSKELNQPLHLTLSSGR